MIIRESIIELALEKLQDEKQYRECDLVVREECAPEFAVDRLYTSKTGGRYLRACPCASGRRKLEAISSDA
jgi:ATP-dependent Clp protease ATP-binding subunit ClpA